MPTLNALELPPPRNWQDFEDLCCDLWRRLWNDPDAQKNGRSGQPQAGVDVFGRPNRGKEWAGIQCKTKDSLSGSTLSPEEIEAEATKARSFKPSLSSLTIATTGPRDVHAQEIARRLTAEGPFSVSIASWSDIVQDLAGHQDLVERYYPKMFPERDSPRPRQTLSPPKLPPHYLERSTFLDALRKSLLASTGSNVGITGQGMHGLQGMGGIGKTVLAAAIAWDPAIRAAFPDGIFWLTVGQRPDLFGLLTELAWSLGAASSSPFTSLSQVKGFVSRQLADRSVLLIADDVWTLDHAQEFDLVGASGKVLLTTRNSDVLAAIGAVEHQLDILSEEQAAKLLSGWVGKEGSEQLPPVAFEVARECGYLPLAIAMIGGMVRLRPTGWDDALARLRRADLEKIKRMFPNYPYPNLLRALAVSVEALDPLQSDRYLELAVFPEDTSIPEASLEVLWSMGGLEPEDSRDLAAFFVARSLARRDEEGYIKLHDLQADYVRNQAADLPFLHRRFVEAYRKNCKNGFASGPDDGYFFQHLPFHLAAAKLENELTNLIFNLSWIEAKLAKTDIKAALADCELLQSQPEAIILQSALRLSTHVLANHPNQLASQLAGRLSDKMGKNICRLLAQSLKNGNRPRLIPRFPTFVQPGGALLRTLDGHRDSITGVLLLNEQHLLSASSDHTLRSWDVDHGKTIRVFNGHTDRVNAVERLDQHHIISASSDRTLRIWDWKSGKIVLTLTGHTDSVNATTIAHKNKVASASSDSSIRIWDIRSGKVFRILLGHKGSVNAVAWLDQKRLISASSDKTLRIWDADSGVIIRTLRGHTREVKGILRIDESLVASLSAGGMLKVWNIDSGKPHLHLSGHTTTINAIAQLDEYRVLSAFHDNSIRIWDADTGNTLGILKGHTSVVKAVTRLDKTRAASASSDNTIRIWDLTSKRVINTIQEYTHGIDVLLNLGSNRIISAFHDGTIRIWDTDIVAPPSSSTKQPGGVNSISQLDDSRVIAALPSHLQVWDINNGKQLPYLKGETSGADAVACINSRYVISAHSSELRIWDMDSGISLSTLHAHEQDVHAIARLDDNHIVSASADRTLRIFNINTHKALRVLKGHVLAVNAVASLNNGRIVSASSDTTLRIWDIDSGDTLHVLRGHSNEVTAVVNIDNRYIVSASSDATLRLWDTNYGKIQTILTGHTARVTAVNRLGSRRLVSSSDDCTLRIWDLQSYSTVATLTFDTAITAVTTLSDGRTIVAGDAEGGVHFLSFED